MYQDTSRRQHRGRQNAQGPQRNSRRRPSLNSDDFPPLSGQMSYGAVDAEQAMGLSLSTSRLSLNDNRHQEQEPRYFQQNSYTPFNSTLPGHPVAYEQTRVAPQVNQLCSEPYGDQPHSLGSNMSGYPSSQMTASLANSGMQSAYLGPASLGVQPLFQFNNGVSGFQTTLHSFSGQPGPYSPPISQVSPMLPTAQLTANVKPPQKRFERPTGPKSFERGHFNSKAPPGRVQSQVVRRRRIYAPGVNVKAQVRYMHNMIQITLPLIEMSSSEYNALKRFQNRINRITQTALEKKAKELKIDDFDPSKYSLSCFGSLKNGFGTKGSDLDLAFNGPDIIFTDGNQNHSLFAEAPRIIEKALLDVGLGARVLDRTRITIIRVCEKPGADLLCRLRNARRLWDEENERKAQDGMNVPDTINTVANGTTDPQFRQTNHASEHQDADEKIMKENRTTPALNDELHENLSTEFDATKPNCTWTKSPANPAISNNIESPIGILPSINDATNQPLADAQSDPASTVQANTPEAVPKQDESSSGNEGLNFPSEGLGIHCDINFGNALAMENSELLKCYCICDHRVHEMGIFIKSWSKARKINSAYDGTLCSYGYVLMVLHFLMNIADPPVIPNLQTMMQTSISRPLRFKDTIVDEHSVRYCCDKKGISALADKNMVTQNTQSLGELLVDFFDYYARDPQDGAFAGGFHWTRDIISLRTPGGTLDKRSKGWTHVRIDEKGNWNRYLLAIEDPFETEHNVARTVVHRGIVAIRDEFRRVWRLVEFAGWNPSITQVENMCAHSEEDRTHLQRRPIRAKDRFNKRQPNMEKETDEKLEKKEPLTEPTIPHDHTDQSSFSQENDSNRSPASRVNSAEAEASDSIHLTNSSTAGSPNVGTDSQVHGEELEETKLGDKSQS